MPQPVHVAVAQLRPRKGDYAANLAGLTRLFAQLDALEPRPQLLHLPETALTGYFLEGGVRDHAVTAGTLARDLARVYREAVPGGRPLDVAVGFYELFESKLYNSALYATLGGPDPVVRHVHRKVFLPTYGMFDEERFVERGREIRAFDTSWGRCAMLVCEDAWHSLSGTLAALDGAQLVLVCAAAPARGAWPTHDEHSGPASLARWERLVRDIADEHGVYVSLAHLVGSEGGKVFAGGSMIVGPKGDVRVRGPLWDEALVTLPLDLGDLLRARTDMPLIADLETMLPHLLATLDRIEARVPPDVPYAPAAEEGALGSGTGRKSGAPRLSPALAGLPNGVPNGLPNGLPGGLPDGAPAADPHDGVRVVRGDPAGRGSPPPLEIDAPLVEEWLVGFIREEMRRRGFGKAIVGVSGGVDSAVTAFLAARALGSDNVIAVRLPYRHSSPESLEHAQLVVDALGIESRTIDISAAVDAYLANEPEADAGRRGNVMARMRMIALFDLSAKHRAIILGTGNKTERLFGYFTWHADDSPPVNPLGDLFKSQVLALATHLGVPDAIVRKPPSADLVAGQTDEADFGISYAQADRILNYVLSGYTDAEVEEHGFAAADVALVRRRLDSTHWKRRLPTVAMVSPTTIGESYLRPVDY